MPEQGHHGGLEAAPPPSTDIRPDGALAGYRRGRSLPFGVELRRQLTRRRTQLSLGFLVVLPFLLVAAFAFGSSDRRAGAPALVDLATRGAGNFTLFTLFVSDGFLLVVVVALFAGDTVAAEASWSSLRYLLAAPVPRGQLLLRKLLVALACGLFAIVLLPTVAYLVGLMFYGTAPIDSPLGASFGTGAGLLRLAIAVGYIAVTMLFVAALAFLVGVWTDAPLGAVGGAVLLVILSNILDAVTALGHWREVLPTHYQYAWTDVLNTDVVWSSMARGALWCAGYAVVLLGFAWRHFLRKDITS